MDLEHEINTLRQLLHDGHKLLPNLLPVDAGLWIACHNTLIAEGVQKGKELDFVSLCGDLSDALAKAEFTHIGHLAEASVCSFYPVATPSEIFSSFGITEKWSQIDHNFKSYYFRMRFATAYWGAVRDVAMQSRIDCISYFGLDPDVVNLIAESSTNNIMDFCHANPKLHTFRLTCPRQDCIHILEIDKDKGLDSEERKYRLLLARLRKSNHCSSFYCE